MTASTSQPVALVTGASGGIGAAAASALAARGFAVAATARRAAPLDELVERLTQSGARAIARPLDVTDARAVGEQVASICDELGQIDVLVNNAASIAPLAPLAKADPQAVLALLEVNIVGALNMVAAAVPAMASRGDGVVINVSSGAADRVIPNLGPYSVSKAGLAMLTRAIDAEYAASGVAVYGFRPGQVATPMQDEILSSAIMPAEVLPDRDVLLDPAAPAAAIAWLAERRPQRWRGRESDIRDPQFQQDLEAG